MNYIQLAREDGGGFCSCAIPDMMRLICSSYEKLIWIDGGPMEFRNSDGSITVDLSGRLNQGLRHQGGDDSDIIACYEFNGAIWIHSDESEELKAFCRLLATRFKLRMTVI